MNTRAKVFWMDLRAGSGNSLLKKLDRLLVSGGMEKLDLAGKFVALKIHFGEPGNMAFVRPPFVAVVSKLVRKMGGRPFLTDANTLYSGGRSNAYDHIRSALENGFSRDATGCDIVIADGLKGNDLIELPVRGGIHCSKAMIGSAAASADAIISVNHFKGHEVTGFGGAIKNLGMGCASRSGKRFLHEVSHPAIHGEECIGCGECVENCAAGAVALAGEGKAVIDHELCTGCCQCVAVCGHGAARASEGSAAKVCGERIAEYAQSILAGKPAFHVSFVMNVSPHCDCWSSNDAPVVADIGVFASLDPVALDQACIDAVNAAAPLSPSALSDAKYGGTGDKFGLIHPDTDWSTTLDHAQKLGIGTRLYELVKV